MVICSKRNGSETLTVCLTSNLFSFFFLRALFSNIMNLRDGAFWALMRQIAGECVGELFAMQEWNRSSCSLAAQISRLCYISIPMICLASNGIHASRRMMRQSSVNSLFKILKTKSEVVRTTLLDHAILVVIDFADTLFISAFVFICECVHAR